MLNVFPSLADARVDYAWGGHVDITMSRAPDFGRLAPNVYYLQGFSGHGIALTGIAGQMVAETIAGQAERFDLFTQAQAPRLSRAARRCACRDSCSRCSGSGSRTCSSPPQKPDHAQGLTSKDD